MADAPSRPTAVGLAPRDASAIRTTLRESVEYALGGFAYKAIALLSVPILARLVAPAELGMLDVAVLIALVVSFTASAGLENALARLDAAGIAPDVLWASAGVILVCGAALIGSVGFVLSGVIAQVAMGNETRADIVSAGVLYGCVLALSLTAQNAIRIRRQPRRYAAYGLAIGVGEMAAALSLAAAGADVPTIVLGWTLASLVGAMVLIVREVPSPSMPSRETIRRLLSFGVPLVPASLVWVLGDLGVRGVIVHHVDAPSLGLFGLATRLTSPVQLLVVGFGLAWHPVIYAAATGQTRALGASAAVRLASALGAASVALTLLAPELVAVVAGPGYEGAVTVVPGLAAGMLFFGLITLATAVLGVGYRLGPVVLASLGGVILQVALAWWLIPSFGFAAAGISIALGYSVTATFLATRSGVMTPRLGLVLGAVIGGLLVAQLALDLALATRLAIALTLCALVALTWLFVARRHTAHDGSRP